MKLINKLNKLLHGELLPILIITALGVSAYVFWDHILNLINLKRATASEMRYISRKVGGYIKYSYTGRIYSEDRIEHELVSAIYKNILSALQIKGLKSEVVVFDGDEFEIHLLPNGQLFISDVFLKQIQDIRQLIFVILRSLELLRMDALSKNLEKRVKYGDFRREFFFFKSRYTGYDVLFINYLTNTRYTLEQIEKADVMAIRTMKEMSIDMGDKK